ncbi:MAG: phycobiliprotein lyase [Cyanobacteria bacterium J06635_10]
MNIEEFFELSAGKWFSHRTSNNLAVKDSEASKSDLYIETLVADNPEVIKLCEQYKVESETAKLGARVTWNGTIEKDTGKYTGSTILALIPNADNPNEGKLLRKMDYGQKTLVAGTYKIGSDDSLTLTTEYENIHSEERLWFASPNLRMRVSVLKRSGGFSVTSFTSEIRMGGTLPAKKTNDAAANAAS